MPACAAMTMNVTAWKTKKHVQLFQQAPKRRGTRPDVAGNRCTKDGGSLRLSPHWIRNLGETCRDAGLHRRGGDGFSVRGMAFDQFDRDHTGDDQQAADDFLEGGKRAQNNQGRRGGEEWLTLDDDRRP
jgi:hypothetical protein